LCEGHIYFELNMGETKIYILEDTLLGWNMNLALFHNLNFTKVYLVPKSRMSRSYISPPKRLHGV
jgi:hypothetical protein